MANMDVKDLFQITEQLGTEDIARLRFLCHGLISVKNLEKVTSGTSLIQELQKADLVDGEDSLFLAELFCVTGHIRLLKFMNVTRESVQQKLEQDRAGRVSPLRKLLYELSEQMDSKDLNSFKFLLYNKLGTSLENMSVYDIFIEMEKRGLLEDGQFEELKNAFKFSPKLLKKIEDFERNSQGRSHQENLEVPLSRMDLDEQIFQEHTTSTQTKAYRMASNPRGYCLIFNNFDFEKYGKGKRKGTHKDEEALEKVFSWLGFTVKTFRDLKADEMRTRLKEYGEMSHEGKDCLVCCVLSHGEQQCVLGVDCKKVTIKEIISHFDGKNCPTLLEKPKVFFIQACQGNEMQEAASVQADGDEDTEADAMTYSPTLPIEADYLIGMATVQDCLSIRSLDKGSWYIQSLCRHLTEDCPRGEEIHSILTKVNDEVSTLTGCLKGKEARQIPEPRYTLRKKLIFHLPGKS
ncbi:caspase-8 isoform X2 [Amia ocellicauda]|uniref:caspase-8 isoform X2 n=1 Tax=Amia ocellicauda TaxID=2972642 RepID=UPI0034642231